MGRKKKEETAKIEKKFKTKKTTSKLKGEDIKTLQEIEKNLLKKCKKGNLSKKVASDGYSEMEFI